MAREAYPKEWFLHFDGDDTQEHTLPASALVKSLQALQRSIQIVAASMAHAEQTKRSAREAEIRFAVILGVPENGGYTLPYSVGGPPRGLFDAAEVEDVVRRHESLLAAIDTENFNEIEREIPSLTLRKLFVKEIANMQPSPRSKVRLTIEDQSRKKVLDGGSVRKKLAPLLAEYARSTSQRTVVSGRLDAIDFQSRTLKLRLGDNRLISGTYLDDLEANLVDNPREWIRIRGNAQLDIENQLQSLTDVSDLEEIDTSPLEVSLPPELSNQNNTFSASVEYLPEDNLYVAAGDLNILATAETRTELEKEVQNALRYLWKAYVEIEESELSADALRLRHDILRTLRNAT